jgi:hypothetical protein
MRGLAPRQELIYRLAVRRLSTRCRGDRQFRHRIDELLMSFPHDLPAILKEATQLGDELAAAR